MYKRPNFSILTPEEHQAQVATITGRLDAYEIFDYLQSLMLCYMRDTDDFEGMNYYCGITNGIQQNLMRHHVDEYVAIIKCHNLKTAKEAIQLLHDTFFLELGDCDIYEDLKNENPYYAYILWKGETNFVVK